MTTDNTLVISCFHSLMFPVVGFAAHPLSHYFLHSLAFIRPWTTSDEDKQEVARHSLSAIHISGTIWETTVPSPAQRKGQTGASHCTQTPGITRGRRLYYVPSLLSGVLPGCTHDSRQHQVDTQSTGILVIWMDYRATSWNGEINIKVNAWIFCECHLEEGKREGNQSLFWNSPRCRLQSQESFSLMKCRELMEPVRHSVSTLCSRGQTLRKITTGVKIGTQNKVPRLFSLLGDILLSGINSLNTFFFLFVFTVLSSQHLNPSKSLIIHSHQCCYVYLRCVQQGKQAAGQVREML